MGLLNDESPTSLLKHFALSWTLSNISDNLDLERIDQSLIDQLLIEETASRTNLEVIHEESTVATTRSTVSVKDDTNSYDDDDLQESKERDLAKAIRAVSSRDDKAAHDEKSKKKVSDEALKIVEELQGLIASYQSNKCEEEVHEKENEQQKDSQLKRIESLAQQQLTNTTMSFGEFTNTSTNTNMSFAGITAAKTSESPNNEESLVGKDIISLGGSATTLMSGLQNPSGGLQQRNPSSEEVSSWAGKSLTPFFAACGGAAAQKTEQEKEEEPWVGKNVILPVFAADSMAEEEEHAEVVVPKKNECNNNKEVGSPDTHNTINADLVDGTRDDADDDQDYQEQLPNSKDVNNSIFLAPTQSTEQTEQDDDYYLSSRTDSDSKEEDPLALVQAVSLSSSASSSSTEFFSLKTAYSSSTTDAPSLSNTTTSASSLFASVVVNSDREEEDDTRIEQPGRMISLDENMQLMRYVFYLVGIIAVIRGIPQEVMMVLVTLLPILFALAVASRPSQGSFNNELIVLLEQQQVLEGRGKVVDVHFMVS